MTRILAALILVLALAGATSAEVIDRVLAVVTGQVITSSDINAAAAFGIAGNLQEFIDRMLMLNEVRRVAPPDPAAAAVQARVAKMRAGFASTAAFTRALAQSGIEESALAVFAADDLRLAAYLDERFSAASQPTDEEVRQAGEGSGNRLAAEHRKTLIDAWIAELRRRADITVLPTSPA